MFAALLPLLGKGAAFLKGTVGQGDTSTAIVRVGRGLFTLILTTVSVAWYTGYRNKRVAPGDKTKFPIPGLNADAESYPVARDNPDVSGYAESSYSGGIGGTTVAPSIAATAPQPGRIPAGVGSDRASLAQLARLATQFGLRVSEYPPYGPVHHVHSSNSLHYQGRAFDASGPSDKMDNFAAYLLAHFGRHITELIHNPNASIKNGNVVPPSFWDSGAPGTWANHKNHVHVGI